jgi:Fic family protein
LIEKSKETYYESLQDSSTNWHKNQNNYEPFIRYFLGILQKAYNEFEERMEYLSVKGQSKTDRIKALIDRKIGKITKKEIMEFCPDISKITVERTLNALVTSGHIIKIGNGRTTSYAKK